MHETLCDRDIKDLNDLKRVLVNSDLRYLKIDRISYRIWGNCPEGLGTWTPFPLPMLQGKSRATFTFRTGGGRMAPMAETITEKPRAPCKFKGNPQVLTNFSGMVRATKLRF